MKCKLLLLVLFVTLVVSATHLFGQSVSTSFSFGGTGTFSPNAISQTLLSDTPQSVAVDGAGNVFIAGTSFSTDFPQVNPVRQVSPCGYNCVFSAPFIAKVDPTGTFLVYSTLLWSSSSYQDFTTSLPPIALAVDAAGNAYVTGTTDSPEFPSAVGKGAFLIKLDPKGSIVYSTLFGGSSDDAGSAIVLGPSGTVHIVRAATSQTFPSVDRDLFLVTLDASTGRIIASTVLGQGRNPQISLGNAGQVNVVATTGCFGCPARVIAKRVDWLASKTLNSTYIGGDSARLVGAAGGEDGSLYVAVSNAGSNLPVTPGVFGPTPKFPDSSNGYLARLDSTGATLFATYLSDIPSIQPGAFAVDGSGNLYVGGTAGDSLPILHASQPTPALSTCATGTPSGGLGTLFFCLDAGFVSAIGSSGTGLNWSTFVGNAFSNVSALATDSKGNVYAAGNGIALSGPNVGKSISIVKFTPQIPTLTVTPQSVTNAASYSVGLPSGRGLATVFVRGLSGIDGVIKAQTVPLPTELGGVSVRVDGVPAPLLAVANTADGQQINFQVPGFFSFGRVGFNLQISQGSNSAFLGTSPAPPGIFLLPDGTPAIQHASDYSLVTAAQPVAPGETIVIYATGLLDTNPDPSDGLPSTKPMQSLYPTSVLIGGGNSAEVLYAGPTPGTIGLYQINCRVPSPLSSGLQTLTISSGVQYPYLNNSLVPTTSKPVMLFVK